MGRSGNSVRRSGKEELGNSFEQERLGAGRFESGNVIRVEECSVQPLTVTESGMTGVAGTGSAKRKVVRKIVIVVKKVIKKKVLKKGLVEKTRDELNVIETTQTLDVAHDVVENFNVVDEVSEGKETLKVADQLTEILNPVNEASAVETSNDVIEKVNTKDIRTENLEFVNSTCSLGPTMGEKGNDPSCIDSMPKEIWNFQVGASVSEQKIDERADVESGVLAGDANSAETNNVRNLEDLIKVKCDGETVSGGMEIASHAMDNQAKYIIAENSSMVIDNKDNDGLISEQNVGPMGENDEVSVVEMNENKIGIPENLNGKMESGRSGFNELLCSGEMEALERMKWRKTEVFVGGLNTDAKEDDIRKVFGEVGPVLEVRLVMPGKTGKNEGFAFVRFATAADAKNALDNYSEIQICGKQCGVVPYVGNDTLYLGNLDRDWKTEDVARLLEEAGLERINEVILKVDSKNIEKNRGFAFVEFETCRDAQIAFHSLQKMDAFGKHMSVKVDWAQPLVEPDEQEVLKVKSVYAEYLPSTWDEEKVKELFKRFGEIENVILAKDLPSSQRQDFAFIRYKTRDAAITCVKAMNREQLEDGSSKVKMVVSLAKPFSKSKQTKHTSDPTSKQRFKAKPMGSQTRRKGKHARSSCNNMKVDKIPSTNDELVQILRQQASGDNVLPRPRAGPSVPDYCIPISGSKRPSSIMAHDPYYVETQGFSQEYMESSYPVPGPSFSYRVGAPSFSYHQERPSFSSEPVDGRFSQNYFQGRDQGQAHHYRDSNLYSWYK